MSSNPLPPEVKAPPGGIRARGGRRPLSRRRWRQRDYMARFGQYATSRGYDVAVRMEDGDMRAVVIRRKPDGTPCPNWNDPIEGFEVFYE